MKTMTRITALAVAGLVTLSLAGCGKTTRDCAAPTPRADAVVTAYLAGPPPVRVPAPAPRPVIPKAPAPAPKAPAPKAPAPKAPPIQKAPKGTTPKNPAPRGTTPRDTTPRNTTPQQNGNGGIWPFYLWGSNGGCR